MRNVYTHFFWEILRQANLRRKKIFTYFSFTILFCFVVFGLQAQDNKVEGITVSAQTGTVTYGPGSSATYTVTITCDQGPADGSTELSLNWETPAPVGVAVTYTPLNPITLTGGQKTTIVTFKITSTANTAADSYNFNVTDGAHISTPNSTYKVDQRDLTVTATASDKVYDGNTTATVVLSNNKVGDDVITMSNTTATFNNKNIGTSKTVSVSGISIIGGTDAGNYTLGNTTTSTTANITAKALTVTAAGVNKPYDGNTSATVNLSDDHVGADDITTSYSTATFDNKNVGTGKTVSVSGISISGGTDAGNYTLGNTTASTTAAITGKVLTLTATGINKTYDGNNIATVNLIDDHVSGDAITTTYTTATFDNKNVGTGKTVSVSGISISGGTDAGNYTLGNTTASTTANITTKVLTVTATASNKVYDGNTTATVSLSSDKLTGDVVTIDKTAANFNTAAVGTNKPVTVTGISISGAGASNYTLASATASATADITAAPTSVVVTLTSGSNPLCSGSSVSFTATVTPAVGSTGTVQFKNGGTDLGGAISVINNKATYPTSALTAGSHNITAVYSGDANYSGSTSPGFTQTVSPSPTANAGPDKTSTGMTAIAMTGATATGTYSSPVSWSGGETLGNWSHTGNGSNPATYTFTPSVPIGSFIATLTVTAASPCGTGAITSTRRVTWGSSGSWLGITSTDWSNASNWGGGAVPTSATNVTIPAASSGVLYMPTVNAAANCNNITINGTLNGGSNDLNVSGNWINNGAFTAGTGTVTFTGATAQTISGNSANSFYKLTINNTNGVTITKNTSVTNQLNFSAGRLITGSNTLNLNSASVLNAAAGKYVFGNLQKIINGNAATTFEIGDASVYAPVTLTFTGNNSTTGTITVSTTAGNHPQMGSSFIDGNKNVNRYWTLTKSGTLGGSYTAAFTFVDGDKDAGTTPSNFKVENYTGSSWNLPVTSVAAANTTTAQGLTTYGDFQVGEETEPTACGPGGNTSMSINITPCISGFPNPEQTVTTMMRAHQFFTMDVIQGMIYQIYTDGAPDGNDPASRLTMSVYDNDGINAFAPFSYSNSVNPKSSSNSNDVFIQFTSPFSGRVRVLLNQRYNCSATTPSGITVYTNVNGGSNTLDDQDAAGIDTWIGHIYEGTSQSKNYNEDFSPYLGYTTEPFEFDEGFGAAKSNDVLCYPIFSNGVQRASQKIKNFAVRFKMNSTRHGLYTVDIGSDDGSRLVVDGQLVYNNWGPQGWSNRAGNLINLSGSSSLQLDYYEGAVDNRITFNNLKLILKNTLSTNLSQSLCTGTPLGQPVSGDTYDTYGSLPSGISLSGTGYQWAYSTTPGDPLTNIPGATDATYTPVATAPFDGAGTYYIYRKAILASAVNFELPTSHTATNISSNYVTLEIRANNMTAPLVSGGNGEVCIDYPTAPFTVNATGGVWTVINGTGSASIDEETAVVTGVTSGGAKVGYTLTGTDLNNGCQITGTKDITILPSPVIYNVTGGGEYCASDAGLSVTLSNSQTGVSYELYKDDVGTGIIKTGSTGTSLIFPVTTDVGTYTYTIIATNTKGCTSDMSGSAVFVVDPLPSGTLTSDNSAVCDGDGILFTATPDPSFTISNYVFKSGATILAQGNSNTFSTNSLPVGPSLISVTVSDTKGCTGTFDPVTITVNPKPTGKLIASENSGIDNDNIICAGSDVNLSFDNPDPTYINYRFILKGTPDIDIYDGPNPYFTTSTLINNDQVSLEVTTDEGCTQMFDPIQFTVNPYPDAAGDFTTSKATVCQGESSIVYTIPTVNNSTGYHWTIPDGASIVSGDNTNSITVDFSTEAITGNVTVEGTNDCGSGTAKTIAVTVNPLPAAAENISGTAIVCQGETAVTYSIPEVANATGYEWNYSGTGATISTTTVTGGIASVKVDFAKNATPGVLTVKGNNDCGDGTVSADYPIAVNLLPAAAGTISGTASLCVGTNGVSYSLPDIDQATGYIWSYDGDGATISSGNTNPVTIDFSLTATSGNLTVKGSNACGFGVTSTIPIIINLLPEGTLEVAETSGIAPDDGIICAGSEIIFTATLTSGTGTNYQFFVGGVSKQNSSSNEFVTSAITANASITVTVTNSNGCTTTLDSYDVTVNPLPVVTIDGPNPICQGSTNNLYTTQSGHGQSNYIWTIIGGVIGNPNGGGNTTDNFVNIDWTFPGTKQINVNYTDIYGCTAATSATLTTSPTVVPTLTGITEVCLNTMEVTYETDEDKSDYIWAVSGGTLATGGRGTDNTITINWDKPSGPHSVSVNYTDGTSHCSAASPTVLPVTVNPLPTATISADVTICQDGTPTLTLTGSGGKRAYTFDYNIDESGATPVSTSPSSDNAIISPATGIAGDFVYNLVKVTDAKGCYSDITGVSSTVTVTPTPSANITYGGTPYCKTAGTASVTQTGTTGGTYSANNGGLIINSTTGEINLSASTPGTYTVTYFITPFGGCANFTTTTTVVVTELPTVSISYGSNPFCTTSGLVNVTRTGTGSYTGGKYSASPAGLIIDENTGKVTPSTSTGGTYTVTYTSPASGGCGEVTATADITITTLPTATITYTGDPYCSSLSSASFTLDGTGAYTGGTYTYTPAGLSLNESTGEINPSASTPGTYYVKYHIPISAGCAAVVTSPVSVTITAKPLADAGGDQYTCAATGTIGITGATASNYVTVTWATSGDGTITNPNSLTDATYTPGTNDIINGGVTLTLTATGNGNCAAKVSSKFLTITDNPIAVVIKPEISTFCVGAIQPLTSVEESVGGGNPTFSSTTNNVSIPDNNYTGISNTIAVHDIPANAIINSIAVKLNITHTNDKDLIVNLKSPNPQNPFSGELNLINSIPTTGTGEDFFNTEINSTSLQPIQNFGTPPYTGIFAPQAVFGSLGTAFATNFSQLYTTGSSVNGNWILRVTDNGLTHTGKLNSWSITITYSIPVNPINVVWSPATDLFTDAAATMPYDGVTPVSTVYSKPTSADSRTIIATAGAGCTTSTSVTMVSKPSPSVTIGADYCSDDPQHRVELTANSTDPISSYNWSDGSITQTTYVDEANNYSVSVTNSEGCVGTNNIDISQELVVNGDFTQGNQGFTSGYTYHEDVDGVNNELNPDTGTNGYGVGTNGQNYHNNFWGQDHTNNQTGDRNFMLVNGHDGITVWEQTVQVLPDTRYYYSAWAMNLNKVAPSARLQFQVNGVNIGTIAELASAPKPSSNAEVNLNNWVRFYYGNEDGWYSGDTTTATIRIVDLESSHGGNDFGIDDISFATLSPFVTGPMPSGSDHQGVCSEEPISSITYKVGSGASGPLVTGLPDDLADSVTFDGLNLVISGSSIHPGTYNYIVSTGGSCPDPKAATGTIVIDQSALLALTSTPESKAQSTCIGTEITPITYSVTGGATSAFTNNGLPDGVFGAYDNSTKSFTISGIPTESGTFTYIVNTTGSCLQKADTGTITISPQSIAGSIDEPTVCIGEDAHLTLTGNNGNVVRWEFSTDGGTNWSAIANTSNELTYLITGPTTFRAVNQISSCAVTTSAGGRVRVNNLWEGKNTIQWALPSNWSAGSLPAITNCSNTVTIPKGVTYDPVLSTTARVDNIHILADGDLTVTDPGKLQVADKITNDGILDAINGSVEFNGSNVQSISSNLFKDTTIKNLIVSNHAGLEVSTSGKSLAVTGKISFGTAAGTLRSGDNITLKSTKEKTASLGVVGDNNNVSGKFSVERYINVGQDGDQHAKKWIFLATPTTGQSIKQSWMEGGITPADPGFEPGFGAVLSGVGGSANGWDIPSPGASVKEYDQFAPLGFIGASSSGRPLYNPKGWFVFVRGDRAVDGLINKTANATVLRSKGSLITKQKIFPVPATESFYPIGNPYPSAVDVKKLFGIDGIYYVWNPNLGGQYGYGAYQTFSYDPGTGDYQPTPDIGHHTEGNYILSGQAFFVQSFASDPYNVEFKESFKGDTTANKEFFRGGPVTTSKLRSNLYSSDQTLQDGTLQIFNDKYNNSVDRFDARKMLNAGINLSVKVANKLLVVERKETINHADTIFFNLTGTANGKYRFQFLADNLSERGSEAWLEDAFTGNRTPVQLEGVTDISFDVTSAAASKAANRFRIVFRPQAPLPVTFVDVKAVKDGSDISVQWKVANEINVHKYVVMKSTDGTNFSDIASVKANGSPAYNSADKNVVNGYNYYRIRSENKNGELAYSTIVKVWAGDLAQAITVYPNPIVKGIINLKLRNQPAGKYSVRLLNPIGQVILIRRFDHAGGNYSEKIPWDYKRAHGTYQMEVIKPDGGVKVIMIMY